MLHVPISFLRKLTLAFILIYAIVYFVFLSMAKGEMEGVRSIINLTGTTFATVVMWLGRANWGIGGKKTYSIWRNFWIGIVLVLIGDITWFGMEHVFGMEVGIPSAADLFFSAGYLFWLYALFCYIHAKKNRDPRAILFDVLITMVVLIAVLIKYANVSIPHGQEMDILARLINLFYPLIDCLYLVALLFLFFVSDKMKDFWRECLCIFIAFVSFFVADQSFLFIANDNLMANYFFDPLWPIGRIFIALAALYLAAPKKIKIESNTDAAVIQDGWYYFQVGAPYFFAILIILTISPAYAVNDPLFLGVNIIVSLVIIRQLSALSDNRKLLQEIEIANALLEDSRAMLAEQNHRLRKMGGIKEEEAATDFLTGLKNRRHIHETLDNLAQTSANTVHVGLMLIDVDNFKPINDTYGHQVGDDILCLVAKAITSVARGTDIAGRFGGDEFILILPGADAAVLEKVSQRLLDAIHAAPMPAPDIRLGLSIGAAAWTSLRADYKKEELLLQADQALYEVKARGRNGYQIANKP